ncbi:MAG: RluA family pseudouridine synthase [Firmicutes bacterium]|nr:RluA family pseudouridine synthase [Bacillota bacterium]MCL1954153.1 RluA family pseudouridine synthase [Bacillota bacterium]
MSDEPNDNINEYYSKVVQRLDIFLAEVSNFTRSKIQYLIKDGKVLVDDVAIFKPSFVLSIGSKVVIFLSNPKEQQKILPQDLNIEILYQDNDIAVINKPQGMTVHPANNIYTDTLVNALLYKLDNLSGINGELRPGIVHRLDKETSGIMLIAKHDVSHNILSQQFKNRTISKIYWGVVQGKLKQQSGTINTLIARHKSDRKKMTVSSSGKHATTKYKVLKDFNQSQLVEFDLLTGRTHQIRVHCKYLNTPIVGDIIYGNTKLCQHQLLHAYKIEFVHPLTNQKMKFEAPLPQYFLKYINQF